VSGGGLWRFFSRSSAETGKRDTVKVLEGVAFHQSALENNSRTIRCHGQRSIQTVVRYALRPRRKRIRKVER
jgi:hypothetical protein